MPGYLDLQPNPFAIPGKNDLRLGPGTLQDAAPPLIAQPAASGPGPNLSQLATPDLQQTGRPGQLAGQAPTPAAPAPLPNAPPMADMGTQAPTAPGGGGYTPMSPADYVKASKPYGDEVRRRYAELVHEFDPGPFASPEARVTARTNAHAAAEKELGERFLQSMATSQYQGASLGLKGKHEQAWEDIQGRKVASQETRDQASAHLADIRAGGYPMELQAKLGRMDAQQLRAMSDAAFKPLLAQSLTAQGNASLVGAIKSFNEGLDKKEFNAGPATALAHMAPEGLQQFLEYAMGSSTAPAVQEKRAGTQQAEGLLSQAMAGRTGGALPLLPSAAGGTPPRPMPIPGAVPPLGFQLPNRDLGGITSTIQANMANGGRTPLNRAIGAPGAPAPTSMFSDPAAGAPEDSGPPITVGDKILTAHAGMDGQSETTAPGLSGPAATPRGPAPKPVTQGLNKPVNEGPAIQRLIKSGLSKDEASGRNLLHRAMKVLANPSQHTPQAIEKANHIVNEGAS